MRELSNSENGKQITEKRLSEQIKHFNADFNISELYTNHCLISCATKLLEYIVYVYFSNSNIGSGKALWIMFSIGALIN